MSKKVLAFVKIRATIPLLTKGISSMEQKSVNPNLPVEAAFSVLKWALIILVINNALWAAIHYGDTKRPSHNTEISVVQDGTGNTQTISQPHVNSES